MTRTITVKGVGNISAKPDYITISMRIESVDKNYDKAMLEAGKRIEMLQNATGDVGYEKDAIKTTRFNVMTRYENKKDRQGNYHQEFIGYVCNYDLKLSFDFDSKQLARVISAIAKSGGRPELGIAFTVKNPAKVSEALLKSATENAMAKAKILCQASGTQLGQLLSIDYNWGELNVMSRTRYDIDEFVQPCIAMGVDYAPEIEPDDIDVSDTVTFVWAID